MNAATTRAFEEWSAEGFKIVKGSKAVGRNKAGVCLFSSAQVVRIYCDDDFQFNPYPVGQTPYDDEMQDLWEADGLGGDPADYGDK